MAFTNFSVFFSSLIYFCCKTTRSSQINGFDRYYSKEKIQEVKSKWKIIWQPQEIFENSFRSFHQIRPKLAKTWPFLVTLLIQCIASKIPTRKRQPPNLLSPKTLRIAIQRAEDAKFSGALQELSFVLLFQASVDTLQCLSLTSMKLKHGHSLSHPIYSIRDIHKQKPQRYPQAKGDYQICFLQNPFELPSKEQRIQSCRVGDRNSIMLHLIYSIIILHSHRVAYMVVYVEDVYEI
ncbi:uncharacterized protein LOC122059008 [Macadamia integrifolia]|uniref:uncharacterized protein LOC122059008 n=1 Tax=Macadamia integrifolia TaxID=60698 RepID=UPI001C5313C5|nr:uncharacterized protein LOC122059008 [Macadamia integrifolia]